MKFISTRSKQTKVSGPEAIVYGISAKDGGLFVPEFFPNVPLQEIVALGELNYCERAAAIIGKFLPELNAVLPDITAKAYARFDGDPAPLIKIDEGTYYLELWHGPTHAFKDIALTLLPYLLTESKKILGQTDETLILVATSGDTGKAALEGFKDVAGTRIAVLYPEDGVSDMQKMQMMTQEGKNVFVSAIKGNFDDAQNAVKEIFTDSAVTEELSRLGIKLSSANSINFGRLVPQVVYYFSAYADLVTGGQIKAGQKVNFCVPSGNFGNILAGWYAKQMGLPINKLVCASNKNNVLTNFFNAGGKYDINREFYKTTSPSMDILISSNLERLIFELCGRNDVLTAERMATLKKTGAYQITDHEQQSLCETFRAGCADEDDVPETICDIFDEYGYIMDTHTAVAANVYYECRDAFDENNDESEPIIIVSTASPYKFADSVLEALGEKKGKDEIASLKKLEDLTALPIPETLLNLPKMEKLFVGAVDKSNVKQTVLNFAAKKL